MTVQGLFDGHEYEFRVSAVNENGQGPPLTGDGPVVARLPFDPPEPPGVPDITQIGENFVNLAWEKPKFDGGGGISGYIVEKREIGTELWQKCHQGTIPMTLYNIGSLVAGRQYEFRVFAVNPAGLSAPSNNSTPV